MEEPMQNFKYVEISNFNSSKGWRWSVMIEREGRMVMIAESDQPLPAARAAAAEAETAFPVNELGPIALPKSATNARYKS
jgi:hypothetical protein